ncbi:MAG: glycine oxidase ThiO [Candidatus Hinthialibacter antarcticus]|nr:glycine oxidase ThiO [Candidatus Hinthialibacter antarcticus]
MLQPTKIYDFLVVGGGVIGLMTTRELLSQGQSVAVIDRSAVGQESSWAGGGILFPVDPGQLPPAGMQLVTWSRNSYQALADELLDETGIDSEWIQSGCIVKNLGQGDAIIKWTQSHGLTAEHINNDQRHTFAPALRENFGASVWLPEIAQIRNPRLLQALKISVLQRGGDIFEHTPLQQIQINNGRAVSAICNQHQFPANNFILAAGAWTSSLLEPFGPAPVIEPVRGQMICIKTPANRLTPIVMEGDYYLIPRKDGRILVGSTVERVGFDKQTTQEAFEALKQAAIQMAPELKDAEVEAHWAGLRPGSPDGIPTIAAHPEIENVYINAGHYRNGLVMAPASARLMTQMALNQTPIFDPAPYAISISS